MISSTAGGDHGGANLGFPIPLFTDETWIKTSGVAPRCPWQRRPPLAAIRRAAELPSPLRPVQLNLQDARVVDLESATSRRRFPRMREFKD
jgi:hypothetical protein